MEGALAANESKSPSYFIFYSIFLLYFFFRIKQIVGEVVSAAVQKEVGAAVQEQVARMSPEVRQEEERRKKQVRGREGGRRREREREGERY